jgi:hypothetical protein
VPKEGWEQVHYIVSELLSSLAWATYAFVLVFLVLCGVNSPSAAADFLFLGVTCTEDISIFRSSVVNLIWLRLISFNCRSSDKYVDLS